MLSGRDHSSPDRVIVPIESIRRPPDACFCNINWNRYYKKDFPIYLEGRLTKEEYKDILTTLDHYLAIKRKQEMKFRLESKIPKVVNRPGLMYAKDVKIYEKEKNRIIKMMKRDESCEGVVELWGETFPVDPDAPRYKEHDFAVDCRALQAELANYISGLNEMYRERGLEFQVPMAFKDFTDLSILVMGSSHHHTDKITQVYSITQFIDTKQPVETSPAPIHKAHEAVPQPVTETPAAIPTPAPAPNPKAPEAVPPESTTASPNTEAPSIETNAAQNNLVQMPRIKFVPSMSIREENDFLKKEVQQLQKDLFESQQELQRVNWECEQLRREVFSLRGGGEAH